MDRSAPSSKRPAAEPATLAPLDLHEDPGDESIYSLSYRARVGAVVGDAASSPAPVPSRRDAEPAGGESAAARAPGRPAAP